MKDSKFEKLNKKNIQLMSNDSLLVKKTNDWVQHAWKYQYPYHFTWLGRPIIQFPQDIIALQEIIWKTKPELIIETGIARGGSIIFSASLLELMGKGKVVGIDIDIRSENKKEIEKHPLSHRIVIIEGSSVQKKVINQINKIAKNKKRILIILDSDHSEKHVLKELNSYSHLIKKGGYLIVCDTFVEEMPKGFFKDRNWNKGNNPKTAIKKFLKTNDRFKIDHSVDKKLLITACSSGFLKCIKN
ncbi:cephalosporin hydroxylase family protein [Candidatus Nitrosopumilus sediminis]|uniref:Motility/biofilm formation protein FlhH n=1 Tax=Candidatus Nitrosopumilus sediminis TaxID=1229909 RepID=K0BBZ9_9ARCH|nr:CmcI family methyltransferase [Candidatus Nitrosopumilus sediminis]AFS83788.1 motility/biofilm formation protein FlhH [Candidatus Nitrosopumilus sediminis]